MAHILCIATLDEHVGLGNGKCLLVKFLSKLGNLCIRVNRKEFFREAVKHLTGAHRHIIYSSRYAFLFQLLTLWCHQEFGHHIDNVASREVSSGLLVITLRELTYQLFEDVSHIHSANLVGTHIGFLAAKLLDNVIENAVVVEFGDFLVEIELLDDIHHILRKVVQITTEVVCNVICIGEQTLERKWRHVIEIIA